MDGVIYMCITEHYTHCREVLCNSGERQPKLAFVAKEVWVLFPCRVLNPVPLGVLACGLNP